MTVTEDVSGRAAGATDGDAGQTHTAAQLQNLPADKILKSRCMSDGNLSEALSAFIPVSSIFNSFAQKH